MNIMTANHQKQLPILYNYRRCPYAMRARMCLVASGVLFMQIDIDLKNKPLEMLKVSPKGTVPVLVLCDGVVLDESLNIMRWALSQKDTHHWLGVDVEQTDKLIEMNDTWFKKSLDIYKYANKHSETECQEALENVIRFYKILEEYLLRKRFLLSDNVSFVDIALFPFIRQSVAVDKEWFHSQNFIMLQKWLDYFVSLELFKKIMQKSD